VAAAVGEGVADRVAEGDALLDADVLAAELPPVLGAAWVQPPSSSTPTRIAPALVADLLATQTTVTAGTHQAREANLPGLVRGAIRP
jgi:hypothetical protein